MLAFAFVSLCPCGGGGTFSPKASRKEGGDNLCICNCAKRAKPHHLHANSPPVLHGEMWSKPACASLDAPHRRVQLCGGALLGGLPGPAAPGTPEPCPPPARAWHMKGHACEATRRGEGRPHPSANPA